MGLEGRSFFFEEGAWERPTPRRIIIRDQTMVKYGPNDGVPPHVDGKDATLLIYLNTVPEGSGGRTVFPEDGLAVPPTQGTALLYRSKTELLHFSEPVEDGENGQGAKRRADSNDYGDENRMMLKPPYKMRSPYQSR